ncbi:MAG: hypothetical protein ACKO9X_04310 [Dolichospermum sp.]
MGWASCPPVVYLITPESAVTGNREQKRGFRQLYFSLLMSVFFRSPIY